MNNKIFRSKSIDRISSPEQLNEYVRVSNPGVWMVLAAIIVLLVGVCVWGIFGRMDATVSAVVVVKDGNAVCYVKEEQIGNIQKGQSITVRDSLHTVASVSEIPVPLAEETDAYILHVGSLSVGEWVYELRFTTALANGVYEGVIVTESFSPMSFLLN